jgi:Peptidase family C25/PKD domain
MVYNQKIYMVYNHINIWGQKNMKKVLPTVIVGILILSGFGAVALQNKEIQEEKMTLSFSQFSMKEKDNCVFIELDGTNSVLMKKDHYMVPTKIETFTFSFGTEITGVQCTPKNVHKQILTKELMISPEPITTGQTSSSANEAENLVSVNTWYDYSIGCGLNGRQREIIVKVEVFPIQYYPEEGYVDWAETIEIEIEYKTPDKITASYDEDYELIILTPAEFSDELSSLVTHKNSRGLSTKLVTLNDIYNGAYFPVNGRDNPEKIKYFIKNAIENWNIKYALLVGGADDFPTRETHVYVDYGDGDAEIFVSDLYYADIYNDTFEFCTWDSNENDVFGEYDWNGLYDDLDLYPDIYVGRLACISGSEVTSCVNKIVTYENNEAYTKDWFTRLVTIGGDTSPNDDEEILEGEYVNQAIIDIMDGFIPTKCWASEGTLGTRSPINSAINNGAGFVDFSGHGNPSLWATHPFNNSDIWIPIGDYKNTHVASLINDDELPIVITGACSVAKFNQKSNCFTWSFVLNPNGGGIASVGPAALSWGYDTTYVIQGLGGKMQLELFKAYKIDGAYTFGEMWARAISNYIGTRMDGGDYKTLEEWQPFGDPTLAIADESLAPEKPDAPEGPSSGSPDTSYAYSASTTDPDGDKLYYLFEWGDGEFSEWVGPYNSGQTVEASHKWSEKGDYEIRVKAKDDHGVQGEWSDPLPISMPKNKLLVNTPFVDFLERFPQLFPILRNLLELNSE